MPSIFNKAFDFIFGAPNPEFQPDSKGAAAAFYQKGIENGRDGKLDEALKNFDKAIELEPRAAKAYYGRGLTHAKKNNPENIEKAIADYTKAIELRPDFFRAYFNRGIAYYVTQKFDEAIADYSRAIELDPKDGAVLHARALVLFLKKDYGKAYDDEVKAKTLGSRDDPGFIEEIKREISTSAQSA